MFKCQQCEKLQARIDLLLATASEERKLFLEAAAAERKAWAEERAQWAKERENLLTRIQSWSPDQGAPTPHESHPSEIAEDVDGKYSQEEMFALGLVPNPEGGVVDVRLDPPFLYESVDEAILTRNFLRKKGMPESTHPAFLTEGGVGEVVQMAKLDAQGKNGSGQEPGEEE